MRVQITSAAAFRGAMRLSGNFSAGVVLYIAASASTAAGQPPTTDQVVSISDKLGCATCRIDTKLWARVQHQGTPHEVLNEPKSVTIDKRGNIVVARGAEGPPLVFDSTGRFVRTIGRIGSGPGEYRNVYRIVVLPGDSLLLLDRDLGRMTVLSPTWQHVRTAPVPDGSLNVSHVGPNWIVLNAEVHDRARFGKPLHLFDQQGNYVRSFGDEGAVLPGRTFPWLRAIAHSGSSGKFWVAHVEYKYLIEQWSIDGKRQTSLIRKSEQFPVTNPVTHPFTSFTRSSAALPWILSFTESTDGLLWVNVRASDKNWRSTVRFNEKAAGEAALHPMIDDADRAFDTILEVIDPRSGVLVASQRFDQIWSRFATNDKLVRYSIDASGNSIFEIHSVRLTRQPR